MQCKTGSGLLNLINSGRCRFGGCTDVRMINDVAVKISVGEAVVVGNAVNNATVFKLIFVRLVGGAVSGDFGDGGKINRVGAALHQKCFVGNFRFRPPAQGYLCVTGSRGKRGERNRQRIIGSACR